MKQLVTHRSALFSADRRYRYFLKTVWDESKPMLCGVLCNPSDADEVTPDNTDRVFRARAAILGYGGTWLVNIFAIVGSNPRRIREVADPIGPENNDHILKAARACGHVLCGWGTNGIYKQRAEIVEHILRTMNTPATSPEEEVQLFYLKMTKDGQPTHPLYIAMDTPLTRWR